MCVLSDYLGQIVHVRICLSRTLSPPSDFILPLLFSTSFGYLFFCRSYFQENTQKYPYVYALPIECHQQNPIPTKRTKKKNRNGIQYDQICLLSFLFICNVLCMGFRYGNIQRWWYNWCGVYFVTLCHACMITEAFVNKQQMSTNLPKVAMCIAQHAKQIDKTALYCRQRPNEFVCVCVFFLFPLFSIQSGKLISCMSSKTLENNRKYFGYQIPKSQIHIFFDWNL